MLNGVSFTHTYTISISTTMYNSLQKPLLKCYICFIYYHSQCLDAVDRIETVKENRFICLSCEEKEKPKNTDQEKEIRKSAKNTRKNPVVLSKPSRSKSVSQMYSINDTISEELDFLGFNRSDISNSTETAPRNSMKRRHSQSEQDPPKMERGPLDDNANCIDNDTSIPNVFEWSTNEVYEYFKSKFPMQAHVFEYEEIDGVSLYLLERDDVIRRFKIKLGPAIKIYRHILELKKKIDDSKLQQQ